MKKNYHLILVILLFLFVLVACQDKTIKIEADLKTTSQVYDLNEFELDKIKIIINKKSGSQKLSLTEEMLHPVDLLLLASVGNHEITVNYQGLQTKITVKINFDPVNYKLLNIYQKLVMHNSYNRTYEDWLSSISKEGHKIVDAFLDEEKSIIISFSDGTQINHTILNDEIDKSVNILSLNDTHGAFYTEKTPGLEKVSSSINFMEEEYGEHLKIAAGDIFQGSYVSNINYGLPLLDALNLMDFDAFVIGNHEFDWGLDKIAKYKDGDLRNGEANFPFLAANIVYKDTNKRLSWTDDYLITENNGYKVGIIGVIGFNLESSIASDKIADYEFLHPVSIVEEHSKTLREKGCDIVLVATHSYAEWEIGSYLSLPYESRIDGIISAHTHQLINDKRFRSDGYQVPIIQSYDKNQNIGQIIISMDDDKKPTEAFVYHHNPYHFPSDLEIIELIREYSEDIEEGNRILGYTPEYLSKYVIGQETTKAMKEKYGVDIAFINTGGVREILNTGSICIKDIYEVFPFDNIVVLTTLSGKTFKELYYKQGSYLYFNPGLDINKIKDEEKYQIATIDYVYTGSYYYQYFKDSNREDKDLMRDVLIEYIEDFYMK